MCLKWVLITSSGTRSNESHTCAALVRFISAMMAAETTSRG